MRSTRHREFSKRDGWYSLFTNSSASYNTGVGVGTLVFDKRGTKHGYRCGGSFKQYQGIDNTANGASALFSNTTASGNTANGDGALANNTTGVQTRRAVFRPCLVTPSPGANGRAANTAIGAFALQNNTTGGANTGIGYAALGNSNGGGNIALGGVGGRCSLSAVATGLYRRASN